MDYQLSAAYMEETISGQPVMTCGCYTKITCMPQQRTSPYTSYQQRIKKNRAAFHKIIIAI